MRRNKTLLISAIAFLLVAGGVLAVWLVPRDSGGVPGTTISVVTIWHQYAEGSPERLYLDGLAERYSGEAGGFQVAMHYYNEQDLLTNLEAVKGGDAPQLVLIKPQYLPVLAADGMLAPLDEREDYAHVADSLHAGAVDTGKYEGSTYGLPFSVSAQVIVYNPELFIVSSQQPSVTMEGLRESAQRIGSLDRDVYGIGLLGTDAGNLAPLIWSSGGELTDSTFTQAAGTLDSGENIALVQTLAGLYGEGSMFIESDDGESLLDVFADGRIGMALAGPAFLNTLVESYPSFSYDTMPVPEGAGGSRSVLDGMLMAIPQSGTNDAGWEYLKILASSETQAGLASRGVIPAGKTALDSASGSVIAPFLPALSSARPLPAVLRWVQMDAALALTVQGTLTGSGDTGDALRSLAEQWDALLR